MKNYYKFVFSYLLIFISGFLIFVLCYIILQLGFLELTIFSILYLSGVILFIFIFIKKFSLKFHNIIDEIQKNLKYCISCGNSLEDNTKKPCSDCGFKLFIDEF